MAEGEELNASATVVKAQALYSTHFHTSRANGASYCTILLTLIGGTVNTAFTPTPVHAGMTQLDTPFD